MLKYSTCTLVAQNPLIFLNLQPFFSIHKKVPEECPWVILLTSVYHYILVKNLLFTFHIHDFAHRSLWFLYHFNLSFYCCPMFFLLECHTHIHLHRLEFCYFKRKSFGKWHLTAKLTLKSQQLLMNEWTNERPTLHWKETCQGKDLRTKNNFFSFSFYLKKSYLLMCTTLSIWSKKLFIY